MSPEDRPIITHHKMTDVFVFISSLDQIAGAQAQKAWSAHLQIRIQEGFYRPRSLKGRQEREAVQSRDGVERWPTGTDSGLQSASQSARVLPTTPSPDSCSQLTALMTQHLATPLPRPPTSPTTGKELLQGSGTTGTCKGESAWGLWEHRASVDPKRQLLTHGHCPLSLSKEQDSGQSHVSA